MLGIDIEDPCPGCSRCKPAKPDDAAFREKVRIMCRVAIETTDSNRSVHILAREVLAMLEKPCPKK
jgi:hypothetical protein